MRKRCEMESAAEKIPIKPDYRYVRIDETRYWNEEFLADIGPDAKIVATYIFNANEVTYCCEITPSYWLEYVGTEFSADRDITDEEYEKFDDIIRENEMETDGHYRHCSGVDGKIISRFEGCDEDVTIDDVREEYCANPW
jgi:hypothetical protein